MVLWGPHREVWGLSCERMCTYEANICAFAYISCPCAFAYKGLMLRRASGAQGLDIERDRAHLEREPKRMKGLGGAVGTGLD